MAKLLTEYGARLDCKGRSLDTALEKAHRHGNHEAVRILKESADTARRKNVAQQRRLET